MAEQNSGFFVNLVKKAVGMPTGSSSCCGPVPARESAAPANASAGSCCSTTTATAPAESGSCCG